MNSLSLERRVIKSGGNLKLPPDLLLANFRAANVFF